MSYFPRAPTRAAAAAPRARRDVTTPLPPRSQPDEETNLTYKPSQLQWVKLVFDADPAAGFYAGRSVQIYGIQPITPSPTQYGNQTGLWRRNDNDTLYRFQKRVKIKTTHIVETPFPVAHVKLLTECPSKDRPLRTCKYGPKRYPRNRSSVFYLSEKMIINFETMDLGIIRLEVPMYTGVTLSQKVSLNQRAGDPITDLNPSNMYYKAEIYIVTEHFDFEHCGRAAHATAFERLDRDKVDILMSTQLRATPRVVSAHKVPLDERRFQKNEVIKDLQE